MGSRLDVVVSAVLVAAAATVAISYGYRTFYPTAQQRAGVSALARHMDRWPDAMKIGHTISGDAGAPTTLVMFGDLECPACRGFNLVLQKAIADHPHDLRVVYVSFPLPYHRFALPAARATECVSERGHIGQWIDLIYRKQDSLGLKSWDSFAREAGLPDTNGIEACANDPAAVKNIEAGLALGKAIDLRGTPTVVINGWIYSSSPSTAQIDSAVKRNDRQRSS